MSAPQVLLMQQLANACPNVACESPFICTTFVYRKLSAVFVVVAVALGVSELQHRTSTRFG